jgi:raffinose/stachyose/melibiose transport system substrate-binding protein
MKIIPMRPGAGRRNALSAITITAAALAVAACAPGPATSSSAPPATPKAASTGVGTAPVTLSILVSTPDVPLFSALGKAFHATYGNVTVKVTSQDFNTLVTNTPHILAGSDVPDIVRIASFGNLVTDRLLTSLDPYAAAYGWNKWPQSQFASTRLGADGKQRGTGGLYGVGPGFGLTGVYYNKALARRIGMSEPPATLAEFEQLLGKAKSAGLLPILINGGDGGTVYPLQNLQMDYAGSPQAVQTWNYDMPGANIDTSATVKAAATLQQWSKDGYFSPGVNSVDQTRAPAGFASGQGVFFPSGNWQAPGLDKAAQAKFGFFLFPPLQQGGKFSAMTAADTLAVPAKAQHVAVAAAFLNFIQTDPTARNDAVSLGGIVPAGPAGAPVPSAPAGSAVAATVAAFQQLLKSNGLVDFMANATASIEVNTLLPQTQLLLAGKTSPAAFATKIQADYESDLGK